MRAGEHERRVALGPEGAHLRQDRAETGAVEERGLAEIDHDVPMAFGDRSRDRFGEQRECRLEPRRRYVEDGLDPGKADIDPEAGTFARLTSEDQLAMMRNLESSGSPFFEAALVATMCGMFADPAYGGNTGKVGWQLIGFEDRFVWQPPFGAYD